MFFISPCAYRAQMVARAVKKIAQNGSENSKILFKNRIGSTARPSGRVGRRSYARFKAEIELQNIRTTAEHDWQPPNVHLELLCPAAVTPAPSRTVPHSDLTKIFSCAVSILASKCLPTYGRRDLMGVRDGPKNER